MPRKMLDCREMPSESGCSLTLTGEADEVLEAGARPRRRRARPHRRRGAARRAPRGLRDAPQATGPGAFVQLIEFQTQQYDQMDALIDGWKAEIGADRTAEWMVMGRDRDRDGTYMEVVEFPSAEAAQRNSDSPATTAFAGKMMALCDGPVTFHNLEVVRAEPR